LADRQTEYSPYLLDTTVTPSARKKTEGFPARAGYYLVSLTIVTLSASGACAATDAKTSTEVTFFAALLALILVGRLLGEAMNRIGQPSVMGQLLAGILLGPSVLGWLWPDFQHWLFASSKEQGSMLEAISQVGILLLLLLTGMETDLKLVRRVGRAAISISLTGVAIPLACGIALGWLLPDSLLPDQDKRLLTSLFLGTALSISSIKIVAVVVREMEFGRRNLGQIIVASAILEDTIGWIIIAITFSLAAAGQIDLASVAASVIGTALFLVASFTVGRRLVSFMIRWTNDNFESDFPVITTILVIMIGMALTTHFIGVHTVLGAFVSGVLIGESPILTRYIDAQLRGLILAFFMPVFFGMAGLSTDLTILTQPDLLLLTLGLIAVASLGKFAGAFVGAEIGGLTKREAIAVACGMNARGSTEVIVATIGLSMGALSQNLYTMIVTMAVTTTMAMPPMLSWALSRVPLRATEKKRLGREMSEAKEFVPNLERLLLAVDDSPNGQFTSYIAGRVAGRRGMPITVLPLANGSKRREDQKEQPDAGSVIERTIKEAAESNNAKPKDDQPAPVDVIVRDTSEATSHGEAVATEAKKGYDLLFIGMDQMQMANGAFNSEIDSIAAAFEGPIAIVIAQGNQLDERASSGLNILVAITGTDVSRRAAEMAFSLGKGGAVTALYVGQTKRGKFRSKRSDQRHAREILNDIAEMASRYGLKIETRMLSGAAPADAILAEAKSGGHDLIVMGVSRRLGDKLFFGDTAAAILATLPCSTLLLST
jgi:Kef-type K+ transport system membrane component KefB/nucleotide-binding universal stress UspA family protein